MLQTAIHSNHYSRKGWSPCFKCNTEKKTAKKNSKNGQKIGFQAKTPPKMDQETRAQRTEQIKLTQAVYDDIWFLRPSDDGTGKRPSIPYGLPVWLENKQGSLECYVIKNSTTWGNVERAIKAGRAWIAHPVSINENT
jgi:hypothetical protein